MLVANKPVIRFDNVLERIPIEESLEITNRFNEEVTVRSWSNCGCTVAALAKNSLGPGETTVLKFTYTPSGGNTEKEFGVIFSIKDQTYRLVIKIFATTK